MGSTGDACARRSRSGGDRRSIEPPGDAPCRGEVGPAPAPTHTTGCRPVRTKPGDRHVRPARALHFPFTSIEHEPPVACPVCDTNLVVHAGREAARGLNVARRLDVQRGVQLRTPVAGTVSDPAGQALGPISRLRIGGVEVHARPGFQVEGDGAETPAGVVGGVDLHRSGPIRVIDDADDPLLRTVGSRHDQRQGVLHPELRMRRYGRGRDQQPRDDHRRGARPIGGLARQGRHFEPPRSGSPACDTQARVPAPRRKRPPDLLRPVPRRCAGRRSRPGCGGTRSGRCWSSAARSRTRGPG